MYYNINNLQEITKYILNDAKLKKTFFVTLLIIVFNSYFSNDIFSKKSNDFPMAPDYSSIDLVTKKITHLELIYKQNNLTLLNLWATWCYPCKEEIPVLKKIYQDLNKYGVDVMFILCMYNFNL